MASTVRKVGVVGAGVIGASWTGLFLAHGLEVIVSDPALGAEEQLQKRLKAMWPTLEKLGLSPGASLDNCQFAGASIKAHDQELDFVQENVPERLELKQSILAEIDGATRSSVPIASSSSGIPSSRLVSQCQHPERVLIGHPFNPPHLMPLVEVVPHPDTDRAVVTGALEFYKSIGKTPILVKQEIPGLVANRLQSALCNEAYSLVNRGILSAEDVDACITTSLGPRWALVGPFTSNVLAGGEGGFRNLLATVGATTKVWRDDMKAHEYQRSLEEIERIDASVQEMIKKHPVEQATKDRDEMIVALLNMKKQGHIVSREK